MAKNVLLTNTSWWACASRLAMGFTECGYCVSAVHPAHGHPLAKTRVVRRSFAYSGIDPIGSLKNAIRVSLPDLIVPCDDRAVGHLHRLHAQTAGTRDREIAELIERSLGEPASFSVTDSRSALIAIATEQGVPVPDTWQVSSMDDLKSTRTAFPWVLKSDGSWGGHGVRLVDGAGAAESAFTELTRPLPAARFLKRWVVNRDPYWLQNWRSHSRASVIAQAYVQGRPANMTASCWRGELLDSISAEVVQAQGATGAATVVRVVESPAMVRAAQLLARRLGLSGFFGLDFMIEDHTGRTFLIEMNPRCTPLSHLALGEGRDPLAALAVRLSGKPGRARPPLTQDDQIAYFPQAWHWDPKSEFLNTSFCDVPDSEPELVQELLRVPWPDRSILARLMNRMRGQRFEDRHARGGFFQDALAPRKATGEPTGVAACPSPQR